jgi:RNA polymerase sigma-70 factor (ECF subfamily)
MEKIYNKYYTEIYLYAFSLCKDHYIAQDLTGDTFYKAMLSIDDTIQHIKYWLLRVCKNLFLDYVRKNSRLSIGDGLEDILSTEESPLDKIIENEEKRKLYKHVMNLHPSYREIIILYYYCGLTLKEMSCQTGLTEGAVKTLLYRARKKLKVELEGKNEL